MLRVASLATIRSQPFGDQLARAFAEQLLRLGGKADAHQALGARQIAQPGQDVGVLHHFQGQGILAGLLLDLLLADRRRGGSRRGRRP